MRRYLRLIALFIRVSLQDDSAYRMIFLGHLLMALLQLSAELVGLWTVFSNTQSLAGWNAWQLLALLGVFRVMSGMIGMFIAPNMRRVMEDVREGTLDFVLIRPVSAQFLASARRIVVWRLTDMLIGSMVAFYAAYKLAGALPVRAVLLFVALLACGTVIIYSFWLMLATSSFWFTRISNIEMVFWNIFEAGRYPVDIYRPGVRWALTYLVPLAFLTTVPASALAGRSEPRSVAVAFVLAVVSFLAASAFWRFGVRRYSGASA